MIRLTSAGTASPRIRMLLVAADPDEAETYRAWASALAPAIDGHVVAIEELVGRAVVLVGSVREPDGTAVHRPTAVVAAGSAALAALPLLPTLREAVDELVVVDGPPPAAPLDPPLRAPVTVLLTQGQAAAWAPVAAAWHAVTCRGVTVRILSGDEATLMRETSPAVPALAGLFRTVNNPPSSMERP